MDGKIYENEPEDEEGLPGKSTWSKRFGRQASASVPASDVEGRGAKFERQTTGTSSMLTPSGRAKSANMKAIEALKDGPQRVSVDVKSVWIFLLRDGELISFDLGCLILLVDVLRFQVLLYRFIKNPKYSLVKP